VTALAWRAARAYVLAMALLLSRPDEFCAALPRRKAGGWPAVALTAAGAVLLVVALALWVRYGTAVFFETIAAAISGCF
jgi:hypothetical protein